MKIEAVKKKTKKIPASMNTMTLPSSVVSGRCTVRDISLAISL